MVYKTYKYRLYPNAEQRVLMAKHIGCARYIYNYALSKKTESYQTTGKGLSRYEISALIPVLKSNEETAWLKEVNSQSIQASIEHLDKAFTRFFKLKLGFPKFKSKHNSTQSFTIPQSTKVNFEFNSINIPKFKKSIKCKIHRTFDGEIRKSTITLTPTGKYFISILVETNSDIPIKKPIVESQAVGIDLGIKIFAVLSDGTEIANPKHLSKSLNILKLYQRRVSRKVKGSKNRKKAVKRLAVLHEKITNKRNDFLHKTSSFLIKSYNTICLETLSAKEMMQNNNSPLARRLSDISICKFNEIIDYKAEWNGNNILRIGRFEPSSKLCTCGVINNNLKLSDRVWTCNSCDSTHNRDVLASNNIKRFAFLKNNTAGTAGINA